LGYQISVLPITTCMLNVKLEFKFSSWIVEVSSFQVFNFSSLQLFRAEGVTRGGGFESGKLELKAFRRFVAIIPNIHLWHRIFEIDILVLQRMFGKSAKNFYEHLFFFDDRSEHPHFSYYEHLIFLS
jgi:hypothetical protein